MGCGSSKAVAPAAAGAAAASPLKDNHASPPQTDVAALHKQRLEQQHSQNGHAQQQAQQQGELCLPGCIESTTAPAPPPLLKELPEVVDLPPLRKGPASAAADAEFDYNKELKKGAALGGPGSVPAGTAGQGAVVGGLLSKQPDWLKGSTDPAATTDANLPAGPTPAHTTPASKGASSLPPLVGRGMGAPAAAGSLPPLFPGGSRALAPLESQHKPQDSPAAGASRGNSGLSATAAGGAVVQDDEDKKQAVPAAEDSSASSKSSKSSASSSRSSSPDQHTASTTAAAAATPVVEPQAHSHGPGAADPWNSLQSQYAHAGGSPSPDSMAGMSVPAPAAVAASSGAAVSGSVLTAAAGGSSLPPLQGSTAAAAGGGSRRVTAQQAAKQQRQSQELVLDNDSDDETAEPLQQKQQERGEGSAAAATTIRSSGSFAGKLSAQSSQHSVSSTVPHVAKSGGWGVGSLAGAGTIMVGAESSSNKLPARKPGAAAAAAAAGAPAAHDDVFGDDEEAVPVLPRGLAAEGSSGSNLRGSHSRVRVGAAGAAAAPQETLDVEEIEDEVDALIESEMARDGLPADLAAKLAQFEAMGADAGSEDGAGSGAESEGPSIFAMMNNRQGSWRAGWCALRAGSG